MSESSEPQRSGVPGWNQGASWRVHTWLACGLALASVVMTWTGALVGATVTSVLACALAFLGGYCYRQAVRNQARVPRFGVFQLLEDVRRESAEDPGAEGPGAAGIE